jgi:hypothetical protein
LRRLGGVTLASLQISDRGNVNVADDDAAFMPELRPS